MPPPSIEQLQRAIAISEEIERLEGELRAILTNGDKTGEPKRGRKRGGMTAAGRAKIAAAQRARWAKVKTQKSPTETTSSPKRRKKRKLSPEARARIVAAVKARWAREKKGK